MLQVMTAASQSEHVFDHVLTRDQMMFMMHHQNLIEAAYASRNLDQLHNLAESSEFKQIFASLTFDEACECYQSTIMDYCRLS